MCNIIVYHDECCDKEIGVIVVFFLAPVDIPCIEVSIKKMGDAECLLHLAYQSSLVNDVIIEVGVSSLNAIFLATFRDRPLLKRVARSHEISRRYLPVWSRCNEGFFSAQRKSNR